MNEEEKKQVNEVLEHNFMIELRKKELNPFLRAELIKQHMAKHNLSGRGFAKKYGLSKSTVEDWLLFSKITEKDYNKMKDTGLQDVEIYRTLRNRKKEKIEVVIEETKLDYDLKECIKILQPHLKLNDKLTTNTDILLSELQDIINRIKILMDKQK